MKIIPTQAGQQAPGNVTASTSLYPTQQAKDSRERAIAKLMGNAPQQEAPTAVPNPSRVSPEEMSAIVSKSDNTASVEAEVHQEASEATSEPAPQEKPASEDPVSKQFALLARKEKALRAKQQQMEASIKAREAELAAKQAELEAKSSSFDPSKYISKDRFKSNPLEVMAETGLSYDEIVQQLVNQTPIDPRINATISKLEETNRKLQERLDKFEESNKTQQDQAYEAAVNQIRTETKKLVTSDPSYEMIKLTGSIEDVVDLIKQTHAKDGILMSVEEAAQEVEDYLLEEAMKLTKANKIKQKLEPARTAQVQPQTQTQEPNPAKQPQQMKTLTNTAASTRKLSARERALLAFKGELK